MAALAQEMFTQGQEPEDLLANVVNWTEKQ